MLRAATTPPHLTTLILMTGTSVLTLNMFVPSLAHMAEDFGVDYGVMGLAVGGYLAMTALTQIVMGPLSDRYGRRPVVLVGMAIFFVASIICALTPDIRVFLAARMFQSGAATGMALSRAMIRDQFEPRDAAVKMATVSSIMAVAPMLGPSIGGFLDAAFGWRASFVLYSLAAAALFVICWADLGETNHHKSSSFGAQFRAYPELFRSRRFWGYSLCAAFSVGTFHIFVSGAALATKAAFGMSPGELGIWMGTITLGFMIGSATSGRISRNYELSTMMIVGRALAVVGIGIPTLLLWAGHVSAPLFFGAMVLSGIGNGLTTPSAGAGTLSIRPHLAGSASGLSAALIVGNGAVVATLTGWLVSAENGIVMLPFLMVLASVAGLAMALMVRAIDLAEARAAAAAGEDPAAAE
ncbi:Bcr/CflA family efflux MFS transporter [Pseudooceanicola sp. 216_PA32_1]|uniref:Bcr/CflA family efflux transporter n=1 Tax=Pseudooceanicola pacificus TaxID=2676438 RepID=A0A844W9Q1_9RHOB|nr:multidrug effflux MFS transporter [Pseudooceanicola pacificus]MWB77603.1 Bcr/CflA family efflux MFS transporter [Pseudooceanicola pacificus]